MPSHKLLASYAKAIAFLLAIVLFHGCSPSVTEQSGVASLKVALKDSIVAPAARDKSTAPVAAATAADDGDDILEMMTILTSVLTSPSGCAYNAQSCSVHGGLIINAGRCERIGTSKLCMQTQGNLVLYASNGTALWASNGFQGFDATGYTGTTADLGNCTNCYAAFQGDGNLVLYNPSFNGNPYHAYWGSNTGGNSGAILTVSQNAPYLSISSAAGSLVWAPIAGGLVIKAGQCVPLGNLKLCMQTQGNLVLYASNGTALWATNMLQSYDAAGYYGTTADFGNCTNCYAAFQGDGNLVLYNPSFNGNPYHAYWGSNTGGNSGAILTVSQNAPYLSIVTSTNRPLIWNVVPPPAGSFLGQTGRSFLPMPDQSGGCNSDSWAQIPGYPNLFAGRSIESGECISDGSVPNGLESLALATMNWSTTSFSFVKTSLFPFAQSATVQGGDGINYSVPAQTIQDGYVIYTAYDPSIILYNSELWVAFECAYVGAHAADSCIGPIVTNGDSTGAAWYVDPSRTTVVVSDGSANPYDQYVHSASVPKLVAFQGGVYLYYSTVRIDKNNGAWNDVNTRGSLLWQVTGSSGKPVFRVAGSNQPTLAFDNSTSVEVMGIDPGNPLSNRIADSFGAYTDGSFVYLTGALGGGNCVNPGGTSPGCYRLSVSKTASPLAYHAFNSLRVPDSLLPVSPTEYTRQFTTPGGSSYFMGNYFSTPGGYNAQNALPPSTTSSHGMWMYPANFESMNFQSVNTSSLTSQASFGSYFDSFTLNAGQSVASGDLQLAMQLDGNLVLYQNGNAVWASQTDYWPSNCASCSVSFQSDGNLVIYGPSGAYWASQTNAHSGAQLDLSDTAPYLSIQQGARIWP